MSSSDSEDDYYGSFIVKFRKLINDYKEVKIDSAELLKDISEPIVLESNGHTEVNTTSLTPVVETEISNIDSLYEDSSLLDQIIARNSVRQTRSQTNKRAISKQTSRGSTQGRGSKNQSKQSKKREAQDGNIDILPNNYNVAAVKRSISQQPTGSHAIHTKRNRRNRQRNVEDKQTIYSVGDTEEYQDLTNGVQLFSTKPLLTLADNDPLDDDEEPVVEISNNDSLYEDSSLLDQIIARNSVRQTRSQTNKRAISKQTSRGSKQGRGSKNQSKQSKKREAEDGNIDILPNNYNVAAVKRSISQQPTGSHAIHTKRNRRNRQRNVEDKQTIYSVGDTEEYQDLTNGVQLFNTKPLLTLADNDPLDDDEDPVVEISNNDSLFEDSSLWDQIIARNSVNQAGSQTNKGAISRSISQRPRGRHSINTERNPQRNVEEEEIIYSVGNTDEYPDLSSGVLLFNTNPLLTLADNDLFDDNEELSVKVYWRSSEIVKFTIRKYQKILQIFDFFVKKENITTNKILLLYNDMILKPDDTPDKIDYNISKFIEGGIVNSVPIIFDSNEKFGNGIELKFQCQNVKKPFIICVQKEDKLQTAMLKCSEHFEKPFKALKFVFDGDAIQGSMTPEELELEGGECIDVKFVTINV